MPDHALDAAAKLQAKFRKLRTFPRTRVTSDDHDLVVAYRRKQIISTLRDWQVRVGNQRNRGAPTLDSLRLLLLPLLPVGHTTALRVFTPWGYRLFRDTATDG